jgi:hypothetical protein
MAPNDIRRPGSMNTARARSILSASALVRRTVATTAYGAKQSLTPIDGFETALTR